MGTVPGPDVAALAVGVGADGFCSSCVDVLAPPVVSWLCGGSAGAAEPQEGPGDRRMHLWQRKRYQEKKTENYSRVFGASNTRKPETKRKTWKNRLGLQERR